MAPFTEASPLPCSAGDKVVPGAGQSWSLALCLGLSLRYCSAACTVVSLRAHWVFVAPGNNPIPLPNAPRSSNCQESASPQHHGLYLGSQNNAILFPERTLCDFLDSRIPFTFVPGPWPSFHGTWALGPSGTRERI